MYEKFSEEQRTNWPTVSDSFGAERATIIDERELERQTYRALD